MRCTFCDKLATYDNEGGLCDAHWAEWWGELDDTGQMEADATLYIKEVTDQRDEAIAHAEKAEALLKSAPYRCKATTCHFRHRPEDLMREYRKNSRGQEIDPDPDP